MLTEKKKTRTAEIPQSSLADIAFLLLIFFLVTTTIDVDKGLSLSLPPKGETQKVRKQNITNLLINAEGNVLLDDQVIDVNAIKPLIETKILTNKNLIVSVKTDRQTPYKIFVKALDQLKQANATRISLAEPES